ncbi:MAG TPA: hypothetical protein VL625_11200 [Patescibacteria group bacterium]|jgi:hypothetical protein|nr:hypothetical protein [Patescibacteria group bacterium]
MARLTASIEFDRETLAKLQSEGNTSINPTGNPYSFHGTPAQLRDFFRQAALPKPFEDALVKAEKIVNDHIERRSWWGPILDGVAIAGGAMVGQPVRSLMEDSKEVEGYPGVYVTVVQPGF